MLVITKVTTRALRKLWRKRAWLYGVAALGMGCLLGVWFFSPPEPLAPKPIARLPYGTHIIDYEWLNRTQLVIAGTDHGTSKLYALDITQQKAELLAMPTKALNEAQVVLARGLKVSRDSKWICFDGYNHTNESVYVVSLEAPALIKTSLRPGSNHTLWHPDSSKLILINNDKNPSQALVYDINQRTIVESVNLPTRIGYPLAMRSDDQSLVAVRTKPSYHIELTRVQLRPAVTLQITNVSFEITGVGSDPTISSDGKKMFWVQMAHENMPRIRYLSKFPFIKVNKFFNRRVYILDCDAHKIQDTGRTMDSGASRCKWTPDGRAISYMKDYNLWIFEL